MSNNLLCGIFIVYIHSAKCKQRTHDHKLEKFWSLKSYSKYLDELLLKNCFNDLYIWTIN